MKATVEEFLEDVLGIHIHVVSDKGWCRACCPIHGESRPSFGVLKVYPYVAKCFSCGYRASLVDLTAKILKIKKEKAVEMIHDRIDIKLALRERDTSNRVFFVSDAVAEMYESCFDGSFAAKYAEYRGLPKWATRLWQLGYDELNHALVVPMRNVINGKIQEYVSVAFQGTFDEVFKSKPENAGLAVTVPTNYQRFDDCVVVEGYIDAIATAIALWGRGIQAVPVALNTAFPTKEQLKFIRRYRRVYLGFDHDEAGEKGFQYTKTQLRDKAFLYEFVYPADLKDPGCLNEEHDVSTRLILK